jgi:hypothetical protein
MKINYIARSIFLALLPLLLTCCGEAAKVPAYHTLVLVDKSHSVQAEKQTEGYKAKLAEIIRLQMNKPGDRFTLRFIHGNTAGVNDYFEALFDIEEPEYDKGKQTQQRQRAQYENAVRRLKGDCLKAIDSAFTVANPTNTARNTDLWSTVEVLSHYFRAASPDDVKQVIYLSDMVESSRGDGRRDFHKAPPASREEATHFARQDADWMREHLDISPTHLQHLQVKMWTPGGAMAGNDFQQLRYYWEALFREFGIADIEYH